MPYGCKLEDLLAILHDRAPVKTDALALQRRRVEHGLLSVGLKIHYLDNGNQFFALVERLGGASKVLEFNMYKHSQASLCLVLPPVGNARAAILLLECIERFTGSALFGNRTLLIHAEHQGYWSKLGEQFEEDMQSLLDRHLLAGLVNAPWVHTGDAENVEDMKFFSALQELVAYVFEESVRVTKKSGILFSRSHEVPARSSRGILHEMQSLLQKYRTEVARQSHLDKGDRT